MAAPTQIRLSAIAAPAEASSTRFFALLVAAGLLNTLIVAWLFIDLPADHHPSLSSLATRAAIYVVFGALAGTAGSWFYWRRPASPFRDNPLIPFRLFALAAAAGWVWTPSVVLLSRQDSPLTVPDALVAAVVLAFALRRIIPLDDGSSRPHPWAHQAAPRQLFAATLHTPQRQVRGYVLALTIYYAGYELANGWILDASALLAACAFAMVWLLVLAPPEPPDRARQYRRAAWRLALVLLPAFFVTLFSLLSGIGHRNRVEAAAAADAADAAGHGHGRGDQASAGGESLNGYQSIILWPAPEKQELLPPIPQPTTLLAPGTTKPLIIRFTGPYFYFQAPARRPGPTAIQAKGTPLDHDFETNNYIPLTVQAHQTLGQSIPLNRCREIQVGILNSDNRRGVVSLAVLLGDSTQPGNQLYLGQQPVASTEPANFAFKSRPLAETLHFAIPAAGQIPADDAMAGDVQTGDTQTGDARPGDARAGDTRAGKGRAGPMRHFDQITVMFLSEEGHNDRGPKIALEQFQLIPR